MTTPATITDRKETVPQVKTMPAEDVQTSALPKGATVPSTNGVKIGLLVPLSGKGAALGQAMVNAAQLAVFDVGPAGFELMPRDTGQTAQQAKQAAQELVNQGVNLLIGPLFAADVAAAKDVAKRTGVSMLALSTDMALAERGVYVMGFAPGPQVQRVIAHASKQGVSRFGAIVPTGPYGALVEKAFQDAVVQEGGRVVFVEKTQNTAQILDKVGQIDALFLPLGGGELRRVAGFLGGSGRDFAGIRLLGTGLWDEPNIATDLPLLTGGWFAAPESSARERFMETYRQTYQQAAPRLATLAYDATAMAAILARSGGRFDESALTNPSGFAGLDGLFRLTPLGAADRGLAVYEIETQGVRVVDVAPTSFSR